MLFKPKWEHKDPRVRARAAAEIDDPRLLELLPEMAANDPDPAVRLQAAKRVTDIHQIRRLAEQPDDAAVRDHAERALRGMLAGTHEACPDLAIRLALVAKIDRPDLIEHLAREGVESEIRRTALERVTRAALLGDAALADPDPELRRLAASRIDTAATLERVAAKSRTVDKRVYRAVTERLTQLRLEAGDPGERARQAGELCLALEQLIRVDADRAAKQAELERLDQQWAALGEPPPEARARFVGARRILLAALAGSTDTQARIRGEVDHYLADCGALDGADLDLLQRTIERGDALKERLASEDMPADPRLADAIAALTERRERLIAEQAPAPALLDLCRRAERIDPQRVRARQLKQLKASWERAWGALGEHRTADQSLSKRFTGVTQRLDEALARQAERRADALARLEQTLEALEASLEAGDLADAVKRKQRLLDDLATIGSAPQVDNAEFKGRVSAARRRLYELRDWQHWANNKVRARLCEEAEAIAGSGMHPDAVAEKVKGLNAQWRELEDSEHLPGDDPNRPANPGLRRRFQAACNRAFKPAKGYFKKRAEIREKHLKELDDLCAEVEGAADSAAGADFAQLERLVARARRSLRKLNTIPPRERSAMSKRLRDGASAIDRRLDAHYEIIERKKRRIIEQVAALEQEQDLGAAVTAAKEAQRQWQQAGRCRRRREQRLWTEFRAACDRVFERLDQQRSEQRAEYDARNQELKELLAVGRKLRDAEPEDLDRAAGDLNRLKDQWRQAGARDRRLESEFQALVRDIEQSFEAEHQRRRADRKRAWRELAQACVELELAVIAGDEPNLESVGAARAALGDDLPEPLAARAARLLEGDPAPIDPAAASANLEAALDLCVRMEFLAGVETPAEYRDARMNHQVRRLSQRMSGESLPPPREEADKLERTWLGCGPLPADQAAEINRRFLKALKAFDEGDHP